MDMTEEMQDDEINLLEYWNIIWRRKFTIIALCTVSVIATGVMSFQSPKYFKSETVIISSSSEAGGLGAALSSLPLAGMLGGAAGIQTPADKIMVVLKSRTTAESVVRRFDLLKIFHEKQWDASNNAWKNPDKAPYTSDAIKMLTTEVTKLTKSKEGAITIAVEWKDPKLAADIANYYVYALTEFMKDKSMNITIQTVDRAIPAERKSRPKIRQNIMLAGVTSLFIGVFVVFFLEFLSKHKKSTIKP